MEAMNSVLPVFIKCSDAGEVTHMQICNAVTRIIGQGKLDGFQRIGNLWRIYATENAARIELFMSQRLNVEGNPVMLYDQNPCVVGLGSAGISGHQLPQQKDKLTIKNVPLSVSNTEIENMLKENGVKFSSSLR